MRVGQIVDRRIPRASKKEPRQRKQKHERENIM